MPPLVSDEDARALVRLVAEVAPLRTDHASAKRYLLNGFAKMIAADGWMATEVARRSPNKPVKVVQVLDGVPSEYTEVLWEKIRLEDPGSPVAGDRSTEEMASVTSDSPREGDWLQRAAVSSGHAPGSSPLPRIMTMQALETRRISLIGMFRRPGKPDFDARERALANLLFTEVQWLHAADWKSSTAEGMPALSPRRKMVMDLLRAGLPRKTIADELGLSIHTVSGYVKEIYAMYRVRSQAELIRRCGRSVAPAKFSCVPSESEDEMKEAQTIPVAQA
jgi:DNA-binding CsgD family transcriptional regulator